MRVYLPDVDADFQAIYRISRAEMLALPSARFLGLCAALPAYEGMVRCRALAADADAKAADDSSFEGLSSGVVGQVGEVVRV